VLRLLSGQPLRLGAVSLLLGLQALSSRSMLGSLSHQLFGGRSVSGLLRLQCCLRTLQLLGGRGVSGLLSRQLFRSRSVSGLLSRQLLLLRGQPLLLSALLHRCGCHTRGKLSGGKLQRSPLSGQMLRGRAVYALC